MIHPHGENGVHAKLMNINEQSFAACRPSPQYTTASAAGDSNGLLEVSAPASRTTQKRVHFTNTAWSCDVVRARKRNKIEKNSV